MASSESKKAYHFQERLGAESQSGILLAFFKENYIILLDAFFHL